MEGTDLLGAYVNPAGKATRLVNLVISGDRVSFDIVGPHGSWHLTGTRAGDRIAGTFQTISRIITWTAVKEGTAAPAPGAAPSPSPGRQ